MRISLAIAIAMMVMVVAGCTSPQIPSQEQEDAAPDGPRIANPASVFCEEQGGAVEIVAEEAGQKGICVLADGTRCDEWAYYRNECTVAAECGTCPQFSPPSPEYCIGGTIVPGDVDECGCRGPPRCQK